jgi:hypothetical protein
MRTIEVKLTIEVPQNYKLDEGWSEFEQVNGILDDLENRYSSVGLIDGRIIGEPLQQEQPEEDLEKEMYNKATSECDIIWNEMGFQLCYDNLIEAFVAGAEWAMKRKEGKK